MSSVYGFMFLAEKQTNTIKKILEVLEEYARKESKKTVEWYVKDLGEEPDYDVTPVQSKEGGGFYYYRVGSVYPSGENPRVHLSKPTRMFTKTSLKVFVDCHDRNTIYTYKGKKYEYNIPLLMSIIENTKGMKKNDINLFLFKNENGKCKRIQSKLIKDCWSGKIL